MAFSYFHYDVFTDEPCAGNQLAVFLDARGLAAARMQQMAREMNFSESTFILPAERPDTDVRMRIFTPLTELPMAGHPTIGSTFALAHAGTIASGSARVVFGLGVGPVPVELEWDGPHLSFARMTQVNPTFGPPVAQRAAVARAIGLTEADLAATLPIRPVSCGLPYLIVPIRDAATVDRAISDASAARRLSDETGIDLPLFLFAFAPPASAYSRMFAPTLGITEDAATGSASGPLGCYLVQQGLVAGEAAQHIVSVQGVAMGRPSRIHVAIAGGPDAITHVQCGGRARLVARGEFLV
ncbi:MAG: PhzF family phenazine biosynthesis protein [Acidobacteria bacterium]|nr:PhzF family phenazine biosynthesis protein [Acidobacteriota bacterium]